MATRALEVGEVVVVEQPGLQENTLEGERRALVGMARDFLRLEKKEQERVLELTSGGFGLEASSGARAFEDVVKEVGQGVMEFGQFKKLVAIYRTNAFSDGLYPSLARVNHSCWPNCEVVRVAGGTARGLVVVQEVGEGQELTHSYLHTLEGRNSRHKQLLYRWGFTCTCILCLLHEVEDKEQEVMRAAYRRQEQEWRDGGELVALQEAVGLSSKILGFRLYDRLGLLDNLYLASFKMDQDLLQEGQELTCSLLGRRSQEARRWSRRLEWPLFCRLLKYLCWLLDTSWRLVTLTVLLFHFWHGDTTSYCWLLVSVAVYSKT